MKKILFCYLLCFPFMGYCQKMPQADDAVREFIKTVQRQDTVKLASLMTHFANFQIIDFDSDVKQVLTKSYQKDNFLYYYVLKDERRWLKEDIGMGVSLVNGRTSTPLTVSSWHSFLLMVLPPFAPTI
jgi:ABC-type proline/glycine betaine transport system ATPase subunit